MAKKLEGKVACVTGASKGIGAMIALQLAKAGAAVIVNYARSKKGADKVVAEIEKQGGKACAIQADLSKPTEVKRFFMSAKKAYKRLDILVNNAGIYNFAPIEQVTPKHFHDMFNLNVLGLLLAIQEAVKAFGSKGGSIINISSVASTASQPETSVYSATKAAVDAITRTLSHELGHRKIRVNSINPGMIETEGTVSKGITKSDFRTLIEGSTPLGRIGKPDDIAPVALFLASDDSRWITGETIFVSGGHR